VQKVFDQFVNFISLEDDLFTLRRHTEDCDLSYYGWFLTDFGVFFYFVRPRKSNLLRISAALNRAEMTDDQMQTIINSIADGLFAVCVTLGVVPIIRCPKGNAAEQVAEVSVNFYYDFTDVSTPVIGQEVARQPT
jgi:hypothetical protein